MAKTEAAEHAAAAPLHHHPHICADCDEKLNAATHAVMKLIDDGKLDQAEHAAQELRDRFPDMHDGYDCLGMVCQARGDNRQAVEYYRKVIAFAREQPDLYDPEFAGYYQALIDHLEPPAAAG